MSKKMRVPDLIRMRQREQQIVMLTAYDYCFASLVDAAGVDAILVGDSLGTVVQGHPNTLSVTLDEMLYHCALVARAVKRALVVGDMPFMSYQLGGRDALEAAGRFVKEAGVEAVKLEGGEKVAETISMIVDAEIPVMAHIGLTPQAYHRMGGHKVQGRTRKSAEQLLKDALAVERAGAFAVVLEGIPVDLAKDITEALSIPTIGIGAGINCSGQILVMHDVLGLTALGENRSLPKFVKQYAALSTEARKAIEQYAEEVRSGQFPGAEHSYESINKVEDIKSLRSVGR